MFEIIKVFNGYSTAFREWNIRSNCKYLHGYSLSFKIWFNSELEENSNSKVNNFKEIDFEDINTYLVNTFDHTTIISKDDPTMDLFEELSKLDAIQLIILDSVGIENFAQYVFVLIDKHIRDQTNSRVEVIKVECFEDGTNNSATYKRR
jgi:6-pyruvoyltetrahydropterin/6-carboxytetrahydropterin synthase